MSVVLVRCRGLLFLFVCFCISIFCKGRVGVSWKEVGWVRGLTGRGIVTCLSARALALSLSLFVFVFSVSLSLCFVWVSLSLSLLCVWVRVPRSCFGC